MKLRDFPNLRLDPILFFFLYLYTKYLIFAFLTFLIPSTRVNYIFLLVFCLRSHVSGEAPFVFCFFFLLFKKKSQPFVERKENFFFVGTIGHQPHNTASDRGSGKRAALTGCTTLSRLVPYFCTWQSQELSIRIIFKENLQSFRLARE